MNMTFEQARLLLLVSCFILISGIGDAQGFFHATNIWQDGRLVRSELAKSALGFTVGIVMYWVSVRYLNEFRIISAEIQTLIWFGLTLIGVAILNGKFWHLKVTDQLVAFLVLIGIGWLLFRLDS
jgi:hypothetical protein